jgi:CBS-domain-containing membrane protein
MMAHARSIRRCTVYRGRGDAAVAYESCVDELDAAPAPIADCAPIRCVMASDLVCAHPDLEIGAIVALLVDRHIGCLPVVDEHRRPIGVITKFDIVEQLDALIRAVAGGSPLPPDLAARVANDVMMPIALSLEEDATVAHATAMMTSEDTHHVLVVDSAGVLVGLVSSKDIVRWVAAHDTTAPREPG